ILFK
ncbi:histone H3, embryonic, partial [Trichinella spiralis]